MKIIIGADFVPTESNTPDFEEGNAEKLFGNEICDILDKADYRIFNLETPLTDSLFPIKKCGPNLSAPTKCIRGYLAAKADLLTLANNHIMDQGEEGLYSTIKKLEEQGISYVGAGKNIHDAEKPFILDINGAKVGIYACAEHEFSIADETHPGANPYDPLESFDAVTEISRQCNFTIVLYHGGKENYRYPTPMLQKRCRKFVQKGAHLVICQHSHCIGCEEKYMNGTIVYGQGNFLFDHSEKETWKTGLLIEITDNQINYIPICKSGCCVRKATDDEADAIMFGFYERSEKIIMPGFVENEFSKLVDQHYYDYVENLSGIRDLFLYRVMRKMTKGRLNRFIIDNYLDLIKRLRFENYIDCEPHRECILQCIKNKNNMQRQ